MTKLIIGDHSTPLTLNLTLTLYPDGVQVTSEIVPESTDAHLDAYVTLTIRKSQVTLYPSQSAMS